MNFKGSVIMIKLIKNYKTRTVNVFKLINEDYKLIAVVSLDEVKDLVNNFDLDIQICENQMPQRKCN